MSTKHIYVEIKLDELELISAESKAIYKQIKEYVWHKFELKVSNFYIAQINIKYGIIEKENYSGVKILSNDMKIKNILIGR